MAEALINTLHGDALRALSDAMDAHFEGLQAAARAARKGKLITNKQFKQLSIVDNAFTLCRHITRASSRQVMKELDYSLANMRPDAPSDSPSTSWDSAPTTSPGSPSTSSDSEESICLIASSPCAPPTNFAIDLVEQFEATHFNLFDYDDGDSSDQIMMSLAPELDAVEVLPAAVERTVGALCDLARASSLIDDFFVDSIGYEHAYSDVAIDLDGYDYIFEGPLYDFLDNLDCLRYIDE